MIFNIGSSVTGIGKILVIIILPLVKSTKLGNGLGLLQVVDMKMCKGGFKNDKLLVGLM